MEISSPFTLSLHLHAFPQNPLADAANFNSGDQILRIKSSTQSPSETPPSKVKVISKFHNRKRRPVFADKDAFPSSLPLHTKNPHAIYEDIQRFARQNKIKEALTIMDYLDQRGIPVNATTFSSLITACVRTKSMADAKQIHAHIRINGLENNEFLRTRLVHMYTACGSLADAQKLFDESSSRSVYPWNALLRGTVMAGRRDYHSVVSTYMEMRRLGVELNVYSFANIIKSFAGASALRQGLKAHALLIKNGLVGSSILGTSLVDMYFKCGKIKLARRVFEEIAERDIVVWGSLIAGFSHNRLQREALEYTRRMIEDGTRPNSVILATILPVIGEVLARRLGQEVHAFVIKTKSYSKQIFIQSALIDMYCKCGDIGSGRAVFYGSMERNAICWTALMSGYALNGRLEQAVRSVIWMQQEGFRPDVVTVATILPVCAELKALTPGKEIHAYALKNYFLPNVSIVSSLMVMYSKCGVMDYSLKLFNGMEQRNVILWTAMIDSYIENQCLHEAIGIFRLMQLSKHRPDTVTMSRLPLRSSFQHLSHGLLQSTIRGALNSNGCRLRSQRLYFLAMVLLQFLLDCLGMYSLIVFLLDQWHLLMLLPVSLQLVWPLLCHLGRRTMEIHQKIRICSPNLGVLLLPLLLMRRLHCWVLFSLYLKVQCIPLCSSGLLLLAQIMKIFLMVLFLQHSCWLQCLEVPLHRGCWLEIHQKLRAICRLFSLSLPPLLYFRSLPVSWFHHQMRKVEASHLQAVFSCLDSVLLRPALVYFGLP